MSIETVIIPDSHPRVYLLPYSPKISVAEVAENGYPEFAEIFYCTIARRDYEMFTHHQCDHDHDVIFYWPPGWPDHRAVNHD